MRHGDNDHGFWRRQLTKIGVAVVQTVLAMVRFVLWLLRQ
ncbi:hypothetical protein NORO109296_19070 [Nocardiopsis rhodophaea]